MIFAYDKIYLNDVVYNLAALFDIAINAEGFAPDVFAAMFAASDVARGIEHGRPNMLAGRSPSEMLSIITGKNVSYSNIPLPRTPEYWSGWILAEAQWELKKPFSEIFNKFPFSHIMELYYPYHEADDRKTIELIKDKFSSPESKIKEIRKYIGLTQEELAAMSGVNIRTIRLYEQSPEALLNASAKNILSIAHILGCKAEEFF